MIEARLYQKNDDGSVDCYLCAHRCHIRPGGRGICKVRENQDGTLYSLIYGKTIAQHIDPIEKKPLFHFYPGSRSYSIAAPGCNFHCEWCQNWSISQVSQQTHFPEGENISSAEVVASARNSASRSIAYTYTEPTVFFEFAYDTAILAHEAGIANVYVSDGFMTGEMLDAFQPYLDAANIDLKAFRDETYRRYIGGRLQPVLDSLVKIKNMGVWVEVTTLVIPGINDDPSELADIADFIAQEMGPDTPWHISRFFPTYKMTDRLPTPTELLQQAQEMGIDKGLQYVYVGNTHGEENTFCHQCHKLLIRRLGFQILENHIREGKCPACNAPVAGVGMDG